MSGIEPKGYNRWTAARWRRWLLRELGCTLRRGRPRKRA